MKPNYFTIHKNKKPKKLKYSKLYSKLELKQMNELSDFFSKASEAFIEKSKIVFSAVDKISDSLTNIVDSMKKIKTP